MRGAVRRGGGPPGGGGAPADGGPARPGGRATNPLVTRFESVAAFTALETAAAARLRTDLYAGSTATASLQRWSSLLAADAGELLDATTLASEKAAIAAYFA